MKRFLLFFVAALLFVSCDNKFEDEPSVNEEDVTLRFTATCSEDVPHLKWDKGDKMSLFLANTYNNKFVFERVENDNAYFIPEDEKNIGEGDALDRIYAVYPYDTNISVSNNGVISLKLSDVQSYEIDGFDPYYNSAVAVTKSEDDRVLNFKGIYGYVTIPLYGDATVESVEIRGNNGENIAGDITILATPTGTPEIYTSERGEESILLDCGEGVTLSTDAENPTEFWFIIPPMRFDSGISLIIHCGEKGDFEPTISKAFVVERNKDISLEAIEVKFKPEVELVNNEIFYTSTDGKIVTPNKSDRFGANITSNTYDDGQGVITFDGEVTKFGDYVFFECDNLETIVIPNSVTSIGKNAFEFCHSLTQVTIPNGVTTLMNGAFYGCTSLESITIPESVTVIEEWTFGDCTMLTSVYCKMATPSSGGIGIFENNAEDRKIYVPVGSGKAYKTANAWKEYAYAIREYDFESGEVIVEDPVLTLTSESEISFSADGGNGEIGYTLENPVEGINVVADSDAEWITNFAVAKDNITFKVAANENKEPRTATITVEYGVLSFNVKITQEGGTIFRLTTNTDMSFSADGGNGEIGYTLENPVEGINVVADSDAEWITNFAVAKDKITFKVAANENKEPRTATITVEYGVLSFNVKITQEGGTIFRLTTNANMSFSADGGNGEIGYTLENPVEGINVVADSDAEWITNFTVAKDKITFKVAANENKEPRTATITVEYGVLSFNVKITQEGGTIFRLTTNANMSFSAEGGNGEIGYTLENPVEGINVVADSDAEWITNFAVAKDNITFKVANNTVVEPRTATITVEYGVLSFNVEVSQVGATRLVLNTSDSVSIPASGGIIKIGYSIINPIDDAVVTYYNDASWITNVAINDFEIQVNVAENNNTYSRSTYLTFGYIGDSGSAVNELKVKITQEAKASQSNNEIWYTSSDGKIVEPYSGQYNDYADALTTFGANIVSNNYKDGKGIITFDGDVTTIGNNAFFYCTSLTTVTIPNSVTTIGWWAFRSCTSLTSVTIPDSVTTIGYAAFEECKNLTSVTIPDSVTTIGKGAFTGCDSLKEFKGKFASDNGRCLIVDGVLNSFANGCGATEYTIPDSVTTIGGMAFTYCQSLTSVTIGDSVTTIGEWAFEFCTNLTSVTIGDSVTMFGDEVFRDCYSLTSVYCKATTPPSLGSNVFLDNHSGRKIYVPRGCGSAYKSATNWSNYAADIVEYDFETGEVIPEGQHNNEIWYTSSNGKIVEPYSTNVFGANIVSNSYKDGKGVITFDGDVTTIGYYAFYNCDSLKSVTIPDSVTTIGDSAFEECTSLTSVTIGDSVTTIGEDAFSYCDSLKSVTIPDSVTTIGEDAFFYCDSLTSVTIPDSVTLIGDSAFQYCTSLTSVTIGDSVTTIGEMAFYGCTSIKEFKGKFAADNGRCLIVDGVLNSFAIGCGATEYTIPDSVTTIGDYAFYNCYSLTNVTIPDSVTTIGECAFTLCTRLKEFKGKFASDGGRCLIKDNTIIAYADASGTEYAIPDGVFSIGDSAFYKCWGLDSVTIPNSVTTIEQDAFLDCFSLDSVYCKATTPPSLEYTAFTNDEYEDGYQPIGCTIYVPRGCGKAYKSDKDWSHYADYIVEYDF